jgi:FkbM family methyltransferase
MKKLVRSFFRAFGLEIRKAQPVATAPAANIPVSRDRDSMSSGLARLKKKGFRPATIIDLGAAAGTWTIEAMRHFPESNFVLFEPLEERKQELEKLAAKFPNVKPVFAAVGAKKGVVNFNVTDDLDGSGVFDSEKDGGNRKVDLVTLDETVLKGSPNGPFLLKFDTHGFELPILDGALETLKKTNVVIMECYGFRISDSCLLFPEMCIHMEKLGFRLGDIINIVRRPGDELFWQCDAFFLKNDNPMFEKRTYA